MNLIYEGRDITQSVQILQCVHRDASIGRSDSLDIILNHAADWYRWEPKAGDTIEINHKGYTTGALYVNTVRPEGKEYRILATSLPPNAWQNAWRSYRQMTFDEIVTQCATECGMTGEVYGARFSTPYGHLQRQNTGAAAFLQRLCFLEGAALKAYNGKMQAIFIPYAQDQRTVRSLRLTGEEPGLVYTHTPEAKRGFVRVVTPDFEVTVTDSGASGCKGKTIPAPAMDTITASRWARGVLLMCNRMAETLEVSIGFDPAMTALARVEVIGNSAFAGGWLVDEAEHDLYNEKTRVKLVRCVTTVSESASITRTEATGSTTRRIAPEVEAELERISESDDVIIGTQTETTAAWTGNARFNELRSGQHIHYWIPKLSAPNVTLNLTLADGTETGAKNVYINGNNRCGAHFASGNLVTMVYLENIQIGSSTYTGWWINRSQDTTTNTYDRIWYHPPVTAAGPIAAGRLGVFNGDGKLTLLSTTAFDITRPILYVMTSYTASGLTQTNNHIALGAPFNLANTVPDFSGTAGSAVFIKGTLAGKMLTPATEVITCAEPSVEDGYVYMHLGLMSTATNGTLSPEHPLFIYRNGAFRHLADYTEVNQSTAGLMSATDKAKLDGIEAEANKYTHPSYTARTGKPTGNQTPGFGETFTVSQIKSNATGHVTAATDRTVKIPDAEATQEAHGLMSATDKAKLDAFGAASTYALKTDLTAVYKYKGSKATVSALPSSGNVQGDVWDVQENGMNYAWNGSAWDALGTIYTPDIITDAQIDAICV